MRGNDALRWPSLHGCVRFLSLWSCARSVWFLLHWDHLGHMFYNFVLSCYCLPTRWQQGICRWIWMWTQPDHQPCQDRGHRQATFYTTARERRTCSITLFSVQFVSVRFIKYETTGIWWPSVCWVTVNMVNHLRSNMTLTQMFYYTSAASSGSLEIHPLCHEIEAFWQDMVIQHMWIRLIRMRAPSGHFFWEMLKIATSSQKVVVTHSN